MQLYQSPRNPEGGEPDIWSNAVRSHCFPGLDDVRAVAGERRGSRPGLSRSAPCHLQMVGLALLPASPHARDIAALLGRWQNERRGGDCGRVVRPLSEWERAVLSILASIEQDGGDVVRESLPHLVVTCGCEYRCASFNVRDMRFPLNRMNRSTFPMVRPKAHEPGLVLWVGRDRRPIRIAVDTSRAHFQARRQSAYRSHGCRAVLLDSRSRIGQALRVIPGGGPQ